MIKKVLILFMYIMALNSCRNPVVDPPVPGKVNKNPYSIIGPASISVAADPSVTKTNLVVDSQDGLLDPDNDEVILKYNIISQSSGSPEDIVIGFEVVDGKGVISVTHPGSILYGHWSEIEIWTEDFGGLSSGKFSLYLIYQSS